MKARIKALERKLGIHRRNATGESSSRRYFVGDGERWQETTFDYSGDVSLAALGWEYAQGKTSNEQLAALESRGVEVIRAFIPTSGRTAGTSE